MKTVNDFKMGFPSKSAGQRMIKNIPLAFLGETILDVRKRIFDKAGEFETLNYIYVVDKERRLKGVISIKEIFQKREEVKIEDLMERKIIKADPYTDQERVAILALRHNLKAIPVVDKKEEFLGVVPSDVILDILHSEHLEDILKSAGVHNSVYFPAKVIKTPIGLLAKARIPWLIVGLFGGILGAQIVNFFETPMKTHFILAAFIPLIVYMADAVGVQSQTLFIRSLVIDYGLKTREYLVKEFKTSFLIALILGILLSTISLIWSGSFLIGLILGLSLFLTVIFSSLIAICIPWLLNKFKKDPAIGSGPFATIVRDILSLIIYFSVSTLLLKFF